jgi:hypothetical protein
LQNTQPTSTSAPGSTKGIAGAKTHRRLRSVDALGERVEHALQLGERHVLVDEKPFDLVEHRRMGNVLVLAVHRPSADHRQWGLVGEHLAHLNVAGVGAQEQPRPDPERVLHVSGRVIGRKAELGEVVLFELDLGTVANDEAEVAKRREDVVLHLGERVKVSARRRHAPGQRDVVRSRVEIGFARGAFEGTELFDEGPFDLRFQQVDLFSHDLALSAGARHPPQELRELLFAEDAHGRHATIARSWPRRASGESCRRASSAPVRSRLRGRRSPA